jgi:hypothetical protein
MLICSFFMSEEWSELRAQLVAGDEKAWSKAIHVFECRMNERFFSEIELLLKSGGKSGSPSVVPGFVIMALCCILVETLQAFYEGHIMEPPEPPENSCPYPDGACSKMPTAVETTEKCAFPDHPCVRTPPTARSFAHFLRDSPHFADFNGRARSSFSIQIRNGLLHDAETRGGWLIRESDPRERILERRAQHYVLNRTRFYNALNAEFKDYLARLGDSTKDTLRSNFLKKMDNICRFEPTVE